MDREVVTDDRVCFDTSMPEPQWVAFAGGHAAYYSQRCPSKETANEDALALLPTGQQSGILVVADGCGGMAQGELAARTAVEALRRHVAEAAADNGNRRAAILDGIEAANHQVQELGGGAATTMAVVEIDGTVMRSYHVGDSTILLVGNRGRIKLYTTSHSPVGYALVAGVLDEREAIHHEDRHLVSNVIGSPEAHIEISSQRRMKQRDTVIIGSDGLFDNLHLDEIVEVARKGPLLRAAQRLAEMATQRMTQLTDNSPSKPDDLTFILFRHQ